MSYFTTRIQPAIRKDGQPLLDDYKRPLYAVELREAGMFHCAFNLPHAAIVSLVQTAVATVPADDPNPPAWQPPPKQHA